MYYVARKLVEIYFRLRYKFIIHGKENYEFLPKGGYIIACNHQTYADPPVVAALIRGKYSFMAKAELFKNPLFAWLIRRCGAFPVVRGAGDGGALDYAVEQVKKGRILVIFPEGTRSKDGRIGRARSGIAVIAAKVNSPIVPVCIAYGRRGEKRRIDIALGKPVTIDIENFNIEDRKQVKILCEQIINEIKNLQQKIISGESPASI